MLNLAFIFHMHQPYYKNLLTKEANLPWVRLHGTKDYLDMVLILKKYPLIKQTFNIVPSLIEQVEDYTNQRVKDKWLELSNKAASKLTSQEKDFILDKFFSINKERVIAVHPRYYELYLKKLSHKEFTTQDFLDLQVWFNLAWTDPYFRDSIPELKRLVKKGRFFTEEEKLTSLVKQIRILSDIIPTYKEFMKSGQVEFSLTPYYHPILPLLYCTKSAKDANPNAHLPKHNFSYPDDARAQINDAVEFFREHFESMPSGMWPSEQSVSEQIVPFIAGAGINWIVTDEAILFKSLKRKKRDTDILYQPHILKTKEGKINVIFRDRNLSDLIGFVYNRMGAKEAVDDFMKHLENISSAYEGKEILVTVAMDGENAWEYFANDGYEFLEALYERLEKSDFVKCVTVSEYLKNHPPVYELDHIASGSWIFGDFGKWIGNNHKIRAWEVLAQARQDFQEAINKPDSSLKGEKLKLAWKQMYICEGSDWFWWYGEDPTGDFDRLFRMHLANLYAIIDKSVPDCINSPLQP